MARLLRYPHGAVFDKRPHPDLALRVRHPASCRWEVFDGVLTVAAPGLTRSYDLDGMTIAALEARLIADGFTVAFVAQNLRSRTASALIEGSGDQGRENGDHLRIYTSILHVILGGVAVELRAAARAVVSALRQMSIKTAAGEWLDLWGRLYGVGRKAGEIDAAYAPRIPEEAFRLRVNGRAIERAILDETGYRVVLREPWKQVFRLNHSKLSGPHRLFDGSTVSTHLIQPVASGYVDWPAVLAVIERNRPAGVMVLTPIVEAGALLIHATSGEHWWSAAAVSGGYAEQNAAWRLSRNITLGAPNETIRYYAPGVSTDQENS